MRAFLFVLAIGLYFHVQAQDAVTAKKSDGYRIALTISPLKSCWVYMSCYYGKYTSFVDSAWLNEDSKGVLTGDRHLPGGVYFITSHKRKLLEFLIDEHREFSLKADTSHPENQVITGAPENIPFLQYNKYSFTNIPRVKSLFTKWKAAINTADSTRLRLQWEKAQQELQEYSENILKKYPESMFAVFMRSIKLPEPPPATTFNDGSKDSLFPARYIKAHYWDQIPLHDDRVLRTPFFNDKLETYFRYYVVPDADSLISEVNYLLLASRAGNDMFKYLLGYFTDKYINPEIMGHDKVFIFLFNQYFSKGDTSWLTAKQREYIFNRAYSLMANQIGETGAALNLLDTAGKTTPMYAVNAPFTFLVFWDPNCGHCKEMIPRIDSIYQARWKKEDVAIYAVNVDEKALDEWKKYIESHHLTNWIHTYQPKEEREADAKANRPNFRQLYDVFQTPTLYLLDREKRIIGKKLSLEQFNQLMEAKQRL